MGTRGGLSCGLRAVHVEGVWVLREALAVGLGQSMLRGCGYSGRPWLWAGAVHVEGVWIHREALAVGWGSPC